MISNNKMRIRGFKMWWIAVLVLACCALGSNGVQAMNLTVKPSEIPITIGYGGKNVVIKGTTSEPGEVIIKISSKTEAARFKYKGKAAGLFWMKIGDIEYKPVPSVYKIYSSGKIDEILNANERASYYIGYDSLENMVQIEGGPKNMDKDLWFKQLVKFKEENGLYGIQEGAVKFVSDNQFECKIHWPFQAMPDDYKIEAFLVKDQHVLDKADTMLKVKRAGIVKQFTSLAFGKPAVYGVMAIVIAMIAGFGVGMVFKGGGAH